MERRVILVHIVRGCLSRQLILRVDSSTVVCRLGIPCSPHCQLTKGREGSLRRNLAAGQLVLILTVNILIVGPQLSHRFYKKGTELNNEWTSTSLLVPMPPVLFFLLSVLLVRIYLSNGQLMSSFRRAVSRPLGYEWQI